MPHINRLNRDAVTYYHSVSGFLGWGSSSATALVYGQQNQQAQILSQGHTTFASPSRATAVRQVSWPPFACSSSPLADLLHNIFTIYSIPTQTWVSASPPVSHGHDLARQRSPTTSQATHGIASCHSERTPIPYPNTIETKLHERP